MRGYALRAAELAGAAAGLATSVVLLIAGCALLGVAAAGAGGAVVAIVIAVLLVVAVFASCDRLALSAMLARPVSEVEQPELYRLVRELSKAGRLPVPRLYLSPADQPNLFAVGRGPRTATICCTEGLLRVLDEAELRGVLVRDQRVRVGRGHLDRLELAVPAETQALRVRPEADRLSVLELDQPLAGRAGLLERGERVVVEDGAVLVDLDERGALMVGGGAQHRGQVPAVGVDRPGHEARVRAERQDTGLNGWSSEPNGVDLVTLPRSEVGEYWPLVSP